MDESKVLETFYVFDLDRTLVDTDVLADTLLKSIEGLGFATEGLRQQARQSTGKSYNLLKEVAEVVGKENLEATHKQFMLRTQEAGFHDRVLEPYAEQLLEVIPPEQRLIFTYGTDEAWQSWKLQASGLYSQPFAITTEVDRDGKPVPKSLLLKQMCENGVFCIGDSSGRVAYARNLVIVDDKPSELVGLTESMEGMLYLSERAEARLGEEKRIQLEQFLKDNSAIKRIQNLLEVLRT